MTFDRTFTAAGARRSEGSAADDGVAELFRVHHLALVRLALLMLGDRAGAEDAVQDVYARLHRRRSRVPGSPDELLAYARASVLNACRTLLRRRALMNRLVQAPEPVWSAENDVLIADDRRRVLQALLKLPPRQREAIILRYYLDLSEAETAASMGVRPGTVKSTVARGLSSLGERYQEER
ncbi:SigE family RNA polymerase sigma factor [Actinomadura macra]|uniref:SigE family RNA polymerase sigma factor n=1 Tax=Actinomadura macra TaxID=46164 RepID=UPI000A07478F|nr:SigE family RNA polymerase sigma factor [Actinomadura macra]